MVFRTVIAISSGLCYQTHSPRWFFLARYFLMVSRLKTPNKSPEPTAVGACSSAIAVHVASRRWLSFLRYLDTVHTSNPGRHQESASPSLTHHPKNITNSTMNIKDLSIVQLQRAIDIKQQIEKLQSQLDSFEGGEAPSPASVKAPGPAKRKYHMTAAHRRKLIKTLARARAIRWAKIKGKNAVKA